MNFDIGLIKRKMLVKYPFFGSVVANVDYIEDKDIDTAGTDGEKIYYNPEFLAGLSVEEQTFVFAHEVCHIAFNHILRSDGKDQKLWNIATDAVINAFLKRDGLKMVEGGVDIADAINYDAENLYERLLQEQNNNQQNQGNTSSSNGNSVEDKNDNSSGSGDSSNPSEDNKENNNQQNQENGSSANGNFEEKQNNNSTGTGDSKSQDVGHDTHSMWEDAVKRKKEETAKKDKKRSLFDKIFNRDKKEKQKEKSEIEKKQEETESLGERESFQKNKEEKKKELQELREELMQQTMNPGSSTNEDIRNVTDVGRSKPIIDWRYILKEATKYDVDWSYKNATIEAGVISANLEEQPMPETEILLDTSGSIDEELLKNFLRECKNILKHSKLKVGCFDTKFYGFHEIRTEEDIENMKFEGGGGTNFDVAVESFSRRVENKIIFTDGQSYMPKTPINAIWIVFGGLEINPTGGKVINIDNEQLEKLHFNQNDNLDKGRRR